MLSLGFVYLLSRWLPRVRTTLTTTVCSLAAATHVLIVNSFGQVELVPVERQRVSRNSRVFVHYIDPSTMQVTSFDYRRNRFVLDPITGLFVPVEELLGLCMPTEDDYFEGLERERVEEAKLFLGSNEISIEEKSGLQIFCNEILHPFYVFQVASFFIWLYEDYAMYAIVILIMATSSATLTVTETKRNLDKMREMARYVCSVKVHRDAKISSMSSIELVPGDVLVLDDQLDILPCDGVIISGDAIVDESMLTGETVPVTKASITYESYNNVKAGEFLDPKCAVFSGTRLLRCRSHHGRPPMVLVTRTGFLTTKGSLVQSILFPRPNNFRFYRDSMLFIGILAVIAFLGFSVAVVNFIALGVGWYWIICRALDVLTVVVPPALPATMAIGTVFAINRLENRQIYCISPPRINIASKVQTICFDKTGTLTEEGLEIFGVISVARDAASASPRLAPITERIDEVSHSDFVRLMATCHGLRKINGRLLGDSLDLHMFEFTDWEIEEFTDVGEAIVPTIVRPRGSPLFNIRSIDAAYGEAPSPFGETGIIRQFDFDSNLRRMSVIARTLSEDSLYVFCKGSPESLFEICKYESLPTNYAEAFASYAHHGYRVIACAYKSCSSLSWVKAQKLTRVDAESDLIFLGFIIFENKLKPQSIPTISALKRASITNIMATGDNILTAISVGRACGLIEEQALVYYPSSFADATSSRDISWQCVDDVELPFDPVKLRPACKEPHEKKKYCLAITGDFFEWMNDHLPKEYCHLLQGHCFIYARMSPHQKQLLVETLQQRSLIVGFCGDGANDCGALKAADVGVSLSQAEASIAAPFTSKIQDISCIPVLLREGRASLVTSFCCFKYMTLYSMIQFTTLIFLYSFGSTLSDGQFIYVDLLLIVPLGILMSRYAPSQSLVAKQPTAKLISPSILSCIFGHIFIQAVAQAAVYFLLARPLASGWKSPIDDESNTLHPSTSVMFLFSAFLYIFTALMFSAGRPFRERVYWPFITYAVIGLATTTMITLIQIGWVEKYLYLVGVPFFTRVAVALASLVYGAVALCYDRFIAPQIARAIQRRL